MVVVLMYPSLTSPKSVVVIVVKMLFNQLKIFKISIYKLVTTNFDAELGVQG